MTSVVLNREMTIATQRRIEQGHFARQPAGFVPQFVAQIQPKTEHRTCGQHRGQPGSEGQVMRSQKNQIDQYRGPQHWHGDIKNAAVVSVSLQRGHSGLGWVGEVFPQPPVNAGHDQIEQHG